MSDPEEKRPIHMEDTIDVIPIHAEVESMPLSDLDDVSIPQEARNILEAADIPFIDLNRVDWLDVIGKGGYAIVYRGMLNGDTVAVKVIENATRRRADLAVSLAREIVLQRKTAATAPEIRGADLPRMGFVMNTACNRTLQQEFNAESLQTPRVRFETGSKIIEAVTGATAAEVVHRDVKPMNLLRGQGILDRVLLTDFGLARRSGDSVETGGAIQATPTYAAPEQLSPNKGDVITPQTDVYGLGATLFQTLHMDHKTLVELQSCNSVVQRVQTVLGSVGYKEHIEDVSSRFCNWQWSGKARRQQIQDVLHGCLAEKPDDRWAITEVQSAWDDITRKM